MRMIHIAAAAASMGMIAGASVARTRDIEIDVTPSGPTEMPPRPTRKAVTPAARDPNHPAVIAAQARQRRKAQRQAKGFVR